jgi:hypothetical protein
MILKPYQAEDYDKPRHISPSQLMQRHMKHMKYAISCYLPMMGTLGLLQYTGKCLPMTLSMNLECILIV